MKTQRSFAFVQRSFGWCAVLAASAGFSVVACGSDDDDDGAGAGAESGVGATGGSTGGGAGRGGGGGGGASGKGGTAGGGATGGSDSGSGGSGNSDAGQGGGGAGGTPDGASGAGASAGEAGSAGDTSAGGSAGAGAGAAGESGAGGSGGDDGGGTIEACFEGLRALEGTSQISTRENAGEQLRLRLALETADRIGTSGTYPWAPVRLALEIDGTLICLDEGALASAYAGTHHNCTDSLSFDYGGRGYEIGSPDSRGLEDATLTVSSGGSVVRGPVTLTATECVSGGGVSTECRSGGPC